MGVEKKYIEFVGPHTAGKTYIIHRLVDGGLVPSAVCMYPQKIVRNNLHFALVLPFIIARNAGNLFFLITFFTRYARAHWINYHAVARHIFKMVLLHKYYYRYDFDVWLKDDMLHLLPRILFREDVDVREVFREFFHHFAHLYDGIVYIDVPYAVMMRRFCERFKNRSDWRRKNRAIVYERSFRQGKILRAVLREQKVTPILELSGVESAERSLSELVAFITNIAHGKC